MVSSIRRVLLALLVGGPLVLCGCATSRAEKAQATEEARVARLREALQRAGDADSLAAAALLLGGQPVDDAQRLVLLSQATARAPARVDLRWLQAEACARAEICDARPAIDALVELDPDNAAPLLLRIRDPDDEAALQADLKAMGEARRFDFYWSRTVAHLARAIMKTGRYAPGPALASAIDGLASHAIPSFQPLTRACRVSATDETERLETCRRIAAVMRRGDTYLVESLGLNLARRLLPANSTERAGLDAAKRELAYRTQAFADVSAAHLSRHATADDLRLYETETSEQAVTLALIARAHRDPQPPAGWQSALPDTN